jgi:hypothetical protein
MVELDRQEPLVPSPWGWFCGEVLRAKGGAFGVGTEHRR